jgi:hypothetical protein
VTLSFQIYNPPTKTITMVSYCPPDRFGTRRVFITCDAKFLEQVYEEEKEWNKMFQKLVQYRSKDKKNLYISIHVPDDRREEYPMIRSWLNLQQIFWKDYKFGKSKILYTRYQRLASLGGFPSMQTKNWLLMIQQLLKYKEKHGNLKVPRKYKGNTKLGKWVSRSICQYRTFKKTNRKEGILERMVLLEKIGLVDDIINGVDSWEDMLDRVLDFKKIHGHTRVPYRYGEIPKLGRWVSQSRSDYRKFIKGKIQDNSLTYAKMKRLETVEGLVDDIKNA